MNFKEETSLFRPPSSATYVSDHAVLSPHLVQFPSGAPQVQAAVDSQAWDVGIAGSVPNVIAGQQNILTVGISNDESATTEVIGQPGVEEWPPSVLSPSKSASPS